MLVHVVAASAARWDPVEPADLAATESTSSPGADAEILFERCTVVDERNYTEVKYYKRVKIYTQKGVEDQGQVVIDYPDDTKVAWLVARVLKRDGSVNELDRSDALVSDVARRIGRKWKKTSLVIPGLEPGDIVECQWSEQSSLGIGNFWRYCQRTIPVRESRFAVEANDAVSLELSSYHAELAEQGRKSGGLFFRFENLKPFVEEDYMIPWRDVRGWVRIRYVSSDDKEDDRFRRNNEAWESEFRGNSKPTNEIKAKAAELVQGAATDEEKLRRLYDFCQNSVTNLNYYESSDIQDVLKRRERSDFDIQPAKDTFAKGGFVDEINYLYAAMVSSLGYKVRLMRNASRDDILNPRIPGGYTLLNRVTVGVLVGETWRYFAPGRHLVPFGMLPWEDEGALALIGAKKALDYENLPVSRADASVTQRVGRFTLDAEGTLEGTVEETLTGHPAIELKSEYWPKTKEQCRKSLEDAIIAKLSTAEVSDISWEKLNDRGYPIVIRYHLRVPAYAGQVGERLVLTPSVFTMGIPPVFAAENRVHPVMFSFANTEKDDVEIVLPDGYELDKPSAPSRVGVPDDIIGATYKLRFNKRTRTLGYERTFTLDSVKVLAFPSSVYPLLRALFDGIHRSDGHSLLLKPVDAAAAAN